VAACWKLEQLQSAERAPTSSAEEHAVGDVACWVGIALEQRRPPLQTWVDPDYQVAAAVEAAAVVVAAAVGALSADVGAEE
jgi:hypothetical protein